MKTPLFFLAIFALVSSSAHAYVTNKKPHDIVSITDIDSSIIVEARYFSGHNFIGKTIAGYSANKCYLTRPAALALKSAQRELRRKGYSIKVYDCYRPQKAVDHFVKWAKNLKDQKAKTEFYPEVEKSELFNQGYIAEKSGHTRGSTLDLTIFPLPPKRQEVFDKKAPQKRCDKPTKKDRFGDNSLDMGTGYDCFSPLSHTANPKISKIAKRNRFLLKSVMTKHGFVNYDKEWWHYTFKKEPYPETYFNFSVK